ncbi:aminoglycoside phosphotransferase family protein [Micromonospora halophytica]|uniref:Predicted kinase, aminoglycoside phosphotransferase (APT) family n=1 Tax=Micromonospora halophytica TaxID=47864 RepID=A0A1C5IA35_9ACTN|nr:aminoglycoside phosphotransferase family protein [Micromonospora halophytica]SCG55260.1 Predicted kinase, aminoglycoside phosphotransferase (APT) family [Micromonospora halophytica]
MEGMSTAGPDIHETLVARLISDQFPQWAALPIVAVSPQGWDNRTFRLGDELTVRLPSAEGYAHQIFKESRWLPFLATHLPVAVPMPIELGRPALGYPFAWSVNRWLDGEVLSRAPVADMAALATDLASFLVDLRAVPAEDDAPRPGPDTAHRGGSFAHYALEARTVLRSLGVESAVTDRVIDEALASQWAGRPVWFHGDVSVDNILVADGRLAGVLDFGCSGVGDPACDLVIAFTYFTDDTRPVFRQTVGLDDETWRRARGWALWKAAITLVDPNSPRARRTEQMQALAAVLRDLSGE